jgi:multifunctional methyltransferase subunit TRM112
MKVLTLNFLTCAVKACKSTSASFPLHPKECELVSDTIELNPKLIYNVLPRVDWAALGVTAAEVLPHPLPSFPLCPALSSIPSPDPHNPPKKEGEEILMR